MLLAAHSLMSNARPHDDRDGLPRDAVVAATELGKPGAEAIGQADAWAKRLDAPLVVAHTMRSTDALVPLLPHLFRPTPDAEQITAVAESVRAQLADRTMRRADDYFIDIEQGSPHASIVRLAQQIEPRVLVIGASEKSPVEHALLGSTAEQILRHAPCSVLVARPSGASGPIVLATDFSVGAEQAERAAAELSRLWQRELVLVHALDVFRPITTTFEPVAAIDETTLASLREAAKKLAAATLERVDARGKLVVEIGDPARMVVEQAERLGAWLVVVATHGRTGFSRMALGSVAERIVRTAPCSVLIAR
jgi:nucleotide-binding universal stress UspA family protein